MGRKFLRLLIILTFFFLALSILLFKIIPAHQEGEGLIRQAESIEAAQEDRLKEDPIKEEALQEEEQAGPQSIPPQKESPKANGQARLIVIDPGHQAHGDSNQETLAPSSSQTKDKVSSGTQGVSSGLPEYQWNLDFSLLLKEVLEEGGYQVLLTRKSNDVNLSNQDRARFANDSGAQAYLRIHANGSDSADTQGIEAYYVSRDNPDAGQWSQASQALSEHILDNLINKTGAQSRGAMARDDLTGSNFAKLPTSLLELGYMSNPEEDQRLMDPAYQRDLAQGILAGLNQYFDEYP